MYVNLIILYKQFNFGLVPQTFGLVTSSNSLPVGQPHLFIFVSPCNSHGSCLAAVSRHLCFFFSLFPVFLRITHRSRAELAFHRPFFSAPCSKPFKYSRSLAKGVLRMRTARGIIYRYLTIILRNRAEYRLILSRRGRRPSRLKSDDIPRD